MTHKEEKITWQSKIADLTDYFKFHEREIKELRMRVNYLTNALDASYKQQAALRQLINPTKSDLQLSISELGLSTSTLNCLKEANIYCIVDLIKKTEPEMLRIPRLGRKRLNLLKQTLTSIGLRFKHPRPMTDHIADAIAEERTRILKLIQEQIDKALPPCSPPISPENLKLVTVLNELRGHILRGTAVTDAHAKNDPITPEERQQAMDDWSRAHPRFDGAPGPLYFSFSRINGVVRASASTIISPASLTADPSDH